MIKCCAAVAAAFMMLASPVSGGTSRNAIDVESNRLRELVSPAVVDLSGLPSERSDLQRGQVQEALRAKQVLTSFFRNLVRQSSSAYSFTTVALRERFPSLALLYKHVLGDAEQVILFGITGVSITSEELRLRLYVLTVTEGSVFAAESDAILVRPAGEKRWRIASIEAIKR